MLLTEWNRDDALQVRWEEGIEKGMEKTKNMVYTLISQARSMDELKSLIETSLPKQQNSGAGTA
jgi:hypothetical protein